MSHVAAVTLVIRDLPALKAACKELGLEFRENQKTWAWFGQFLNDFDGKDAAYRNGIDPANYGQSEHAIRLPGCHYEIGVVRNNKGELTLAYDFFGEGRKIRNALGAGCEKLVQHYGLNKAQMLARTKGYITQRKVQPNGDIKLVVTGV